MIGFGFLNHELQPFDVFLVLVDRKTDADVFFFGEVRILVGFFDSLQAFFYFLQLVLQGFYMLEGEAVDGADLIFDVFGIAGFAGFAFQPLGYMVQDVEGAFGAVDHMDQVHFDLLLLTMGLSHDGIYMFWSSGLVAGWLRCCFIHNRDLLLVMDREWLFIV